MKYIIDKETTLKFTGKKHAVNNHKKLMEAENKMITTLGNKQFEIRVCKN